jgi:hypothetical protein
MNTPEYPQSDVYAEHPAYSNLVGVFRDRSQATQAVEDLRKAGIEEDQIRLGEYTPQTSGSHMPIAAEEDDLLLHDAGRRILVHVHALGREQEVVSILAQHGANNADVPPGTELVQGYLIHSHTSYDVVEHPLD